MKIRRQHGQSLFDIAIQYCGDATAALEIALMNNISLTDDSFSELTIPASYNKRVVDYYRDNSLSPATSATKIIQIITHNREPIITHNRERIITHG
jgi:hypothetical protein